MSSNQKDCYLTVKFNFMLILKIAYNNGILDECFPIFKKQNDMRLACWPKTVMYNTGIQSL